MDEQKRVLQNGMYSIISILKKKKIYGSVKESGGLYTKILIGFMSKW